MYVIMQSGILLKKYLNAFFWHIICLSLYLSLMYMFEIISAHINLAMYNCTPQVRCEQFPEKLEE